MPHPRAVPEVLAFLCDLEPSARLVAGAAGHAGVMAGVVGGVTLDSGAVRPGDLFAGLPGGHCHGAAYAGAAARAGAVVMLSDRASPELPCLVVPDPRRVLGPLAAWLHGHPSRAMAVHGVTGTNGKTSTTHLLAAGLAAAGRRTGLASTLEVRAPDLGRPAERTTAEAPDLQAFLAGCRAAGATDVALEVSSHGIALDRVTGVRFRTAVFTNLSPDHLDLHGDLDGYYAAKAALFTPERCELAVVGVDDAFGRRLARTTRCPVVTVSGEGGAADWRARDVRATVTGTAFRLTGPGVDREVSLALLGPHQASNALAAVAALVSTGLDVDDVLAGIATFPALPGRLERVDAGQPYLALVDFAHNTGGHRRLLPFLRSLTAGRLVVVMGATGQRDPGKRAALGRCVAERADVVVVTDESAHGDDPAMLRRAVADGARAVRGAQVVECADRAEAIAVAVAETGPGDVVVVVGRGADQTLVTGGEVRWFDDRVALRAAVLDREDAGDVPACG
ncbi:MAG: UDP-N-acetylmuramoyl-L-alanyl-D-glutamate--2,6-diaminopimelate ligase [Pseudonocardia sediminis]